MVSISACHADDPGSIPGRGEYFSSTCKLNHNEIVLNSACCFSFVPSTVFRDSIVVSISACHADDPGSIPGRGEKYSTVSCNIVKVVRVK